LPPATLRVNEHTGTDETGEDTHRHAKLTQRSLHQQ
jgi:hypothetical protein